MTKARAKSVAATKARKRKAKNGLDSPEWNFTPGPWRACQGGRCSCRQVWSIPGDVPVFTAHADKAAQIGLAHHKWGDLPDLIYGVIPESSTEANARLIAAAPDLYGACQIAESEISLLTAELTGGSPPPRAAALQDALIRIRAAIALANSGRG